MKQKTIQDYIKSFRETFQFKLVNNFGESWGVEDQRLHIESWLTQTLTAIEKQTLEDFKRTSFRYIEGGKLLDKLRDKALAHSQEKAPVQRDSDKTRSTEKGEDE